MRNACDRYHVKASLFSIMYAERLRRVECYSPAEECTGKNNVRCYNAARVMSFLRIRFVFKTIFFKKSLSGKINVRKLLLASIFSFATRVTKSYLDFYLSRKIKALVGYAVHMAAEVTSSPNDERLRMYAKFTQAAGNNMMSCLETGDHVILRRE